MTLSKNKLTELKKMAQNIKPKVLVGKNGLTEGTIQSIQEVLAADELVKVKFLNNAGPIDKSMGKNIASQTNADFIQLIGKTIVLYKEKED